MFYEVSKELVALPSEEATYFIRPKSPITLHMFRTCNLLSFCNLLLKLNSVLHGDQIEQISYKLLSEAAPSKKQLFLCSPRCSHRCVFRLKIMYLFLIFPMGATHHAQSNLRNGSTLFCCEGTLTLAQMQWTRDLTSRHLLSFHASPSSIFHPQSGVPLSGLAVNKVLGLPFPILSSFAINCFSIYHHISSHILHVTFISSFFLSLSYFPYAPEFKIVPQ